MLYKVLFDMQFVSLVRKIIKDIIMCRKEIIESL